MTTKMTRALSDSGDYDDPFEDFDADGDAYNLAWRYLGAYIDTSDYSRKALWAGYYDPNYEGNQIGEYQYYDADNKQWDNSTCVDGSPCTKMDCHDTSSSTWELVGVYKESIDFGGDAFFEQLFKHQGVCLWDNNNHYKFMQSMRETLESDCQYITSGVYVGIKPAAGGEFSYGLYKDSYCKNLRSSASSRTVDTYLTESDYGSWDTAFSKFNQYMDAYKICQPCRAYTKYANQDDDWEADRRLKEENDGQGDEEQNGFNCYDDAGYRNCNQCYKFETHTDMEEASADDLYMASKQKTILKIKVDGSWYGKYSYGVSGAASVSSSSYSSSESSSSSSSSYYAVESMASAVIVMVALTLGLAVGLRPRRRIMSQRQALEMPVL